MDLPADDLNAPEDDAALVPVDEEDHGFEAAAGEAEKSITDHALEAKDKFVAFAKEHPVATVAGGLALGVLVASMFKGPRRAAAAGGAKAAGLAALGSEIALAFAGQVMDAAKEAGREGARKLDGLGESVGDTARKVRRDASYRADRGFDAARIARREARKKLIRAFKQD